MNERAAGSVIGPPSADGARAILLAIVRERQGDNPEGVRSTKLGAEFSKRTGVPFEPYINAAVLTSADIQMRHRKMRPFIENYCKDILEYLPDPSGNGFVREFSAENNVSDDTPELSGSPLPRYRKGIWVAFVRPLPPKLKRYVNLGDRAGFTDIVADQIPEPDWVEVQSEFIAAIPPDQPVDAIAVHKGIVAWIAHSNVDEKKLIETDIILGKRATIADLTRVIDSLPDAIISEWNIPALVIKHLSK